MNESNSTETIDRTNLNDQTKFRLSEICKTENYSNKEIKERKLNSKKLSKYGVAFDYIDKIVMVFSATSGRVFINSFTSVIRSPARIASTSFNLVFSLNTRIIKKLLSITTK